jgi:thiosulfate dehydrogenase
MAHLIKHSLVYLPGLIVLFVLQQSCSSNNTEKQKCSQTSSEKTLVPDINELSNSESDNVILYGKKLIDSTANYFGPRGSIATNTNGLNCENCHRESGTKLYTNNFLAVASTYPKFRDRSGRLESIEFRINECLQRSLNGRGIDSLSKEMRAIVAYIKWTGKNVTSVAPAGGIKSEELPFLQRAADPLKGKTNYLLKCKSCHGENGEGSLTVNSIAYKYPPLWGEHSYAVSAGMYRLTKLASFIKSNMPLGATYKAPLLNDEEAWDLAAYINTQPHPKKMFRYDWPVLNTKPVDYPFGPYADSFLEVQHKYGPFWAIKSATKK